MVQAHGAVGGGGRAEVLQIGAVGVVQLSPQPFLHALHVGHFLHDLHADGGAQQLGLRLLFTADFHHPGGLAALIGQQTKLRHKAGDGAHQLQNAGIAVAAGAQDGVGVHHGGGFRPAEHLALGRLVAHLIHITGAAVSIVIQDAQLLHLLLKALLLGVHDLVEHKLLQERAGNLVIHGPGVCGELLTGGKASLDQLVIHIVDRGHDLQAEADNRMAVLAVDGHHAFRAEGIAVHHQGLDHLGHYLALGPIQQGLLLRRKDHFTTSL